MPERRPRLLLAPLVLAMMWEVAVADDPKKPEPAAADGELLEFLGSVDADSDAQTADDGSWIEYLSQTDIGKVADKAIDADGAARKKPVSDTTPATSGDKKND